MNDDGIKKAVRKSYGRIAVLETGCCPGGTCGTGVAAPGERSRQLGYSEEDLRAVPEGADLGLGCGNPLAIAAIGEGETVLDLGSGAGFDCFLAARRAGPTGRVIGVDMTPEMVEKARENARKSEYGNVEFRQGDMENLPVDEGSVDVILSNCVINLAPDKKKVFREAFRVLKHGGRLLISDIVLIRPLPDPLRDSAAAYVGCIAGAVLREDYLASVAEAGFTDIRIDGEAPFPVNFPGEIPLASSSPVNRGLPGGVEEEAVPGIVSLQLSAVKPLLPISGPPSWAGKEPDEKGA